MKRAEERREGGGGRGTHAGEEREVFHALFFHFTRALFEKRDFLVLVFCLQARRHRHFDFGDFGVSFVTTSGFVTTQWVFLLVTIVRRVPLASSFCFLFW